MSELETQKVCDAIARIKTNIDYIEKAFNHLQDIRFITDEMHEVKKDVNKLVVDACDSLECSFCDDITNRITSIKSAINSLLNLS